MFFRGRDFKPTCIYTDDLKTWSQPINLVRNLSLIHILYGAEGANGVVLITSKRGIAQKTRVDINAQFSIKMCIRDRMKGTSTSC